MPRRNFKTPFAVSGDQATVPTEIQPDGSVSIIQGYGPDYQRPTDGTDPQAKVIDRATFNGLMNDITASIGEVQLYGMPAWSSGMAPYPANAQVMHKGSVWSSRTDNNSSEPGSDASWVNPLSRGVQKFTSDGTFVVPAGVNVVYLSGSGGGGGGGGGAGRASSSNAAGGGGGGGAGRSALKEAVSVVSGQSIAVRIGAAGSRGAGGPTNSSGGTGGSGGETSFGSLLSLSGGAGGGAGIAGVGSGGAGGVPGGQWGGDGIPDLKGGDGGSGGGGPFGTGGGGGRAKRSTGVADATAGFAYGGGGGGGGGAYGSATSGSQGGAGMPGVLIVEW